MKTAELIHHLQQRGIAYVRWMIFFNNDENSFGPGRLTFADGREQPFEGTTHDNQLDSALWDIASTDWDGNREYGTGVYLLDVAQQTTQRVADAVYDYEHLYDEDREVRDEAFDVPPSVVSTLESYAALPEDPRDLLYLRIYPIKNAKPMKLRSILQ